MSAEATRGPVGRPELESRFEGDKSPCRELEGVLTSEGRELDRGGRGGKGSSASSADSGVW